MTTPSKSIVAYSRQIQVARDDLGRHLGIRRLDALHRLRLLKAAGPHLSQNDAWLNIAALACSVAEIDGVPRAMPSTETQIETLVAELGDAGLQAVASTLTDQPEAAALFEGTPEGNASGTPN